MYNDDAILASMVPDGVQISGRYWTEGPIMIGLVHLQTASEPYVIREEVDLREVAREVQAQPQIMGFFGSLVRAVKKVGRSKLLRKIKNSARKVLRSKITGTVFAGVAAVFPVVGVPALAAYASANQALKMAERGGAIAKKAKRLLAGTAKRARAGDPKAKRQAAVFALLLRQRARARRRARALGMPARSFSAGPNPYTLRLLRERRRRQAQAVAARRASRSYGRPPVDPYRRSQKFIRRY